MQPFIVYPFPLREGQLAYLKLPCDLKDEEVKRIETFLRTLIVEQIQEKICEEKNINKQVIRQDFIEIMKFPITIYKEEGLDG